MDSQTHHSSDVDTWKHPDRSYVTFVIISILFGFLGWDHLYLRSFGTGASKFLLNCVTFGMWYWWDLIQIYKDGKTIQTEGLASPLDWIRGIGRGVFVQPTDEVFHAKKSYLIYAFLAILFGWLGLDKFYLGEMWQGLAKVLSCFNIFLFLFGWLWVVWDSFHAFASMDSILKSGVQAPLPYSLVFSGTVEGDVFKVTEKGPGKGLDMSMGFTALLDSIAHLFRFPSVPTVPLREAYRELVVPLVTPPLVNALQHLDTHSGPSPLPSLPSSAALPTLPLRPQSGGGDDVAHGPGPVLAGALTAVVLAGGLKGFYDLVSNQRG